MPVSTFFIEWFRIVYEAIKCIPYDKVTENKQSYCTDKQNPYIDADKEYAQEKITKRKQQADKQGIDEG